MRIRSLLWLLAMICEAAGAGTQEPRTQAQLRAVRERIERVTAQVSHDAAERDRLTQSLRTAELSLGDARGQLSRLHDEYADRSARRASLATQRKDQQATLEREREALAGQLRAAYMLGHEEPLKLLLNQEDPLHGARILTYYGYFSRARASQLTDIQARVQRIDALDAALGIEQDKLAALKDAQQQQLDTLERARDDRRKVLVSLTLEARSRQQSLERLQAQQASLETLLQQLNRAPRSVAPPDATAFGRLRGELGWPVSGRLIAEFGQTRASGVKWDGLMVATGRGTPVRAVAAGRVVYADWLPGLGLLVIVDHGDGYLSLYGHNDRLYKAVGEPVSAGETVAAAGDTGGRSDPALYFEIRRSGKPVDPRPWFREKNP